MSERDELRGTLSNTICNASNYTKRAQPYLLGSDMSVVLDKTADAILAAGYRKPRPGEIEGRASGHVQCEDCGKCRVVQGEEWCGDCEYRSCERGPDCTDAPTDVAYLLAELRKRDEALTAVRKIVDDKYRIWAAICGNTCNKDLMGVDHDAIADEINAVIHAAINEALGDIE